MAGGAAVGSFDEGWRILQEAINKLIANAETERMPYITIEEYMRCYTVVYNVAPRKCNQKQLYDHYMRTFEDYLSYKVLPCLRGKEDENLLRELLRRWNIYKTVSKLLSNIFKPLSRSYKPENGIRSLEQTTYLTFYDQVYGEFRDQVVCGIISLINRERLGEQIDQDMVKQVLDIFQEIGEKSLKNYMKNIEIFVGYCPPYPNSFEPYTREMKLRCDEISIVSEYLRLTNKDKVLEEVYGEIESRVCDAILSLERNNYNKRNLCSKSRAEALLKQVRQIFEEFSAYALKIYAKDIEEALVGATAFFYSKKALEWINAAESYEDYMLKGKESFEKENYRFSGYLRLINKNNRVLEVVQHELLNVHAAKLEKLKACSQLRCLRL